MIVSIIVTDYTLRSQTICQWICWNELYPAFPAFCIIYRGGSHHLHQYGI